MTEIIEEWAAQYPDGHRDENFLTKEGAAEWLRQHPGGHIVGRIHLIGDWTPEEEPWQHKQANPSP